MSNDDNLVYIGKVVSLDPIEDADFIVCCTVVCGQGGKWRGVVKKTDFELGDLCVVFLPDSQLDPMIHSYLPWMKDSGWRVKMRRFRGAPSEVLIIQLPESIRIDGRFVDVGSDVTRFYGVTKYNKPVPAHLNGLAKGNFPSFIPKTDEPNYQSSQELVDRLVGKPYYITEKCDGSSTTAYRYKGEFGICSRNLELERNLENGYWKIAEKYKVEENLMEGYAIQWETCGPGIQSNPMGLKELDGFMFSAYKIDEHRYLSLLELKSLSSLIGFPMARILEEGDSFDSEGIDLLGEGMYGNGKQREGVVVRSQEIYNGVPISFKVINLGYEK